MAVVVPAAAVIIALVAVAVALFEDHVLLVESPGRHSPGRGSAPSCAENRARGGHGRQGGRAAGELHKPPHGVIPAAAATAVAAPALALPCRLRGE